MYVKYGTFSFNPWEAGLSVRQEFLRSRRGFKQYQRVQYTIDVDVCVPGQYDITTRLDDIITAFSTDGGDIGLYHDNDTPSHHFMSSTTNNLTGNQVLNAEFLQTIKGEYTSGRKFQIVVGALLYDPESLIVDFHDSLLRSSNAGPQWRWKRPYRNWPWIAEVISPNTMQTIIHKGYSVGLTGYPLPPIPYYSPPFEENHKRQVLHQSPIRHPQGFTEFRVDWTYYYRLPTFDDISVPYAS